MKKALYIFLISTLGLLCSCKEKANGPKTLQEKLCGEWHSISLPEDLQFKADIYLSFSSDGVFELYQMIDAGAYRLYRGTWQLNGSTLSGEYNDGESWASSYEVAMNDKTMTLISQNGSAEKTVYESCTIPDKVRNGCDIVVKSDAEEIIPVL